MAGCRGWKRIQCFKVCTRRYLTPHTFVLPPKFYQTTSINWAVLIGTSRILGIAESLSKEVRAFGVRVHILVLGQFRTPILSEERKQGPLETGRGHPDYKHIKEEMSERHVATHGLQPGDPEQAAQKMIDIVKVEGMRVKIDEIPLRVPLGSDAVQVMRTKCQDTLQLLEGWEKFAGSTDFPDGKAVPSYYR